MTRKSFQRKNFTVSNPKLLTSSVQSMQASLLPWRNMLDTSILVPIEQVLSM
jgi:hypothetical protein